MENTREPLTKAINNRKDIKQEDLLISNFITKITDKKRQEILIREKNTKFQNINGIRYTSYERRHNRSAIPTALAKIKVEEEPP